MKAPVVGVGRSAHAADDRFAQPDVAEVTIELATTRSSLAVPFGLGVAIGGSIGAGLTGLLWGGAVRVFVLHHVTYSINSLCHFYGRRRFDTDDHSRNLAWLSLASLGEAWHNNHHAFPTSAFHGLRRLELDPSALVITLLERTRLVWDVVRVSPERQATHRGLSRQTPRSKTSASKRCRLPARHKPTRTRATKWLLSRERSTAEDVGAAVPERRSARPLPRADLLTCRDHRLETSARLRAACSGLSGVRFAVRARRESKSPAGLGAFPR